MPRASTRIKDHAARQLLIIDAPRDGEIRRAPELIAWIDQGWHVEDVSPRVTEEGAKVLVTLRRENRARLSWIVDTG